MINKAHSTRGPYILVGRIPPSLNLSSLETLSLAYNHLEGNIPHVLGRLSNLNSIFLGSNNLSGIIPHSLYILSDIRDFHLRKNQLVVYYSIELIYWNFSIFNIQPVSVASV
ncbi:hypothetical protein AHAS_Ahas16G0031600 [Arachis hypogaea]